MHGIKYAVQVFLILAVLPVLTTSCGKSSVATIPVSNSTDSTYPAEISGQVIIPHYIYADNVTMQKNETSGDVFWVVEVSVKNDSYKKTVSCFDDDFNSWQIVADGEAYAIDTGLMRVLRDRNVMAPDSLVVPAGQSGNFTVLFSVPDGLNVSDARLCYRGQEPVSYGELTGGDPVEMFEWNQRVITQLSN
jgi:hypothetical protein